MKPVNLLKTSLFGISVCAAVVLGTFHDASAHCDTLDGPVVQDARKAIEAREISPVLKWVKPKDEKAVRAASKRRLPAAQRAPRLPRWHSSQHSSKYTVPARELPIPA